MLQATLTSDRVQEASRGIAAFDRAGESAVFQRLEPGRRVARATPITEREREVLALVAEGWSNRLIGAYLRISERTVKSHLSNIMAQLQASDRTHAVVIAVRLGWLAI